jgi:hypothetical protein
MLHRVARVFRWTLPWCALLSKFLSLGRGRVLAVPLSMVNYTHNELRQLHHQLPAVPDFALLYHRRCSQNSQRGIFLAVERGGRSSHSASDDGLGSVGLVISTMLFPEFTRDFFVAVESGG